MMRLLPILPGLAAGLALAVLVEGRMAHLRQFLPGVEPAWARALSDDSGLPRGAASLPSPAGLPLPADLSWRFARLTLGGPVWDLALSGPGLSGRAALRWPLPAGPARIEGASGEVALDSLPPLSGIALGGLLRVEAGAATFDPARGRLGDVAARLSWLGARIDGQAVGAGEMRILPAPDGGWRAPFTLSGDVAEVRGTLEGRAGQGTARLSVTIEAAGTDADTKAGTMPRAWRRALDRHARRGPGGWTLEREITLSAGWPPF